ncbi:hypothetical protein F4782DRAFT_550065 [Xylaria castorea]|nr:hypothetical protein F4782DRAFT_550065 [Xylaria castorea]
MNQVQHDCQLHHLQLPQPEILIPDRERRAVARYFPDRYLLIPNSYDATELANAISAIARERREFTSKQSSLIYEFVGDYLCAPSTNDMTQRELHDLFYSLLVQIDTYFFQGGLTQGTGRPYVKLILLDQPHLNTTGFYKSMQYNTNRIIVYLRNSSTGKRRSKVEVLTTLVHEMAHAYLGVFFNFCPVRGQSNLILENRGHGVLWKRIFLDMCTHMQTWHPSLIEVGVKPEGYAGDRFVSVYYGIAGRLPWIRREWEVTSLRWFEISIFRGWHRKPTRKDEFKRALLRLSYDGYTHFVSTRVPYPWIPYRLYVSSVLLIILLSIVGLAVIVANFLKKHFKGA